MHIHIYRYMQLTQENLSRTLDWSTGQRDASDVIWISMNDVGASVARIHSPIFIHSFVYVTLTHISLWLINRVRFVLNHLLPSSIFIFLSLLQPKWQSHTRNRANETNAGRAVPAFTLSYSIASTKVPPTMEDYLRSTFVKRFSVT